MQQKQFNINLSLEALPAFAQQRVRYVLDFVAAHPCATAVQFHINEAPNPAFTPLNYAPAHPTTSTAKGIFIPCDTALLSIKPAQKSAFYSHSYLWGNQKLHSATTHSNTEHVDFFCENRFGFDWISTIFFHLSRIEEYLPDARDPIGLMPAADMLAVRSGHHHQPVVDHLVVAVLEALGVAVQPVSTAITTSHDVDTLQVFGTHFNLLRYLGGTAFRHKKISFWPTLIADYWKVKNHQMPDPADNFEALLTMPSNTPKKIYFGTGKHAPEDQFPDLNHPRLLQIKALALENGYELGFHPGFGTWKNAVLWAEEKEQLAQWFGAPVRHSRQHFLRFSFPETCDILENEGIETDSSLGYRDHYGFRCGTGFPFHLYCFATERPYRWKEIPLVLMDIGFLRAIQYNNNLGNAAIGQFLKANAFNTHININFHNSFFYEQELAGIPLLSWYSQLLKKEVKLL